MICVRCVMCVVWLCVVLCPPRFWCLAIVDVVLFVTCVAFVVGFVLPRAQSMAQCCVVCVIVVCCVSVD